MYRSYTYIEVTYSHTYCESKLSSYANKELYGNSEGERLKFSEKIRNCRLRAKLRFLIKKSVYYSEHLDFKE